MRFLILLFTLTSTLLAHTSFKDTTFIAPKNDAEAQAIIELLKRSGADDIRVSNQGWGARLDKESSDTLENLRKKVVIIEMPSPELEERLRNEGKIVEVIDHHDYGDLKRFKPQSSLEQIAERYQLPLSRIERGIAINDRAYIFGLVDAGYTNEEILKIRDLDLRAQGISEQDLLENKRAYGARKEISGTVIVETETSRVSLISDLHTLEAPDKVRDLLIISRDKTGKLMEVNFYGSPAAVNELHISLGGWKGGNPAKSMYWGNSGEVDLKAIQDKLKLKLPNGSCLANAFQSLK